MPQKRSFPRICIALGLPDVPTLLDHARREAESGETFLEFRLDYLDHPGTGRRSHSRFPEQFPECIILATCRRHQNHGKFNGSIEEQLAVLDVAVRRRAGHRRGDRNRRGRRRPADRVSRARARSSFPTTISNPRRPWMRC